MRWIVLTLLISNIAYFAWEFIHADNAGRPLAAESTLEPLAGKKLVLLTERLPAQTSSAPPPAPIVVVEPTPVHRPVDSVEVKKQSMCVSVGPYEVETDGKTLIKNLSVEGYQARLESLELSRDVQFWVLLPPAKSRKEAMAALRNLQAKRIDSYLISSGEMKNAISLGLFNKEQSARGVLASVREAGFPAELLEKERVQSEFWVRIPSGQALENLQKTLETLVVPGGSVKISNAACEMFAQTK